MEGSETVVELAAIVEVTPEFLASMLQLPDGAHIDGAWSPPERPGLLLLRVRGAGWPTKPGHLLPTTTGVVTTHYGDGGVVLGREVNWGFPECSPTPTP